MIERRDLDGLRLTQADQPDVWLVFDGRLHKIRSPNVYISLFDDDLTVQTSDEVDFIDAGPTLENGSCLVQGLNEGPIYLLANYFSGSELLEISSWASFLDFGFSPSKIHKVPELLLKHMSYGTHLTSALDVIRLMPEGT